MKKIIYSLMLCLSVMLFTACEEDPMHDDSRVTYYATLELKGSDVLLWAKGTSFVDPGYVSEMQGEDVSDQVVVSGNVDVQQPGIYNLDYSIVNNDGFVVSTSRQVFVYDTTPSPIASGFWTTTADSYRINAAGAKTVYGKSYDIVVFQVAPGEFFCSDYLGGYYCQRAGYGSKYELSGYFTLNDGNTISDTGDSFLEGWGDSLDDLTEAKFDPATGAISWNAGYAGMDFYVTLTK